MDEIDKLAEQTLVESQIKGERSIAKFTLVLMAIMFAFAAYILIEGSVENGISAELKRPIYYIELLCIALAGCVSVVVLRFTGKGIYAVWMRYLPSFIGVSCISAVNLSFSTQVGFALAFTGVMPWCYMLFLVLSVFRNSAASVIFTGAYSAISMAIISMSAYGWAGNFAEGANIYKNAVGKVIRLDFDDEVLKPIVTLAAAGVLAFTSNRFKTMVRDQINARIERERSRAEVSSRTRSAALEIGARSEDLEGVSSASAEGVAELTRAADRIKAEVGDELALVHQVGAAVAAIAASTKAEGESVRDQALVIESALASMGIIVGTVKSAAAVAKEGSGAAKETLSIAEQGGRSLTQAASGVARAEQAGERISEIARLISDVADQTNLLAMNAAIEAAHAGASGKGFAVVAAEIRKLAEGTQANARQIGSVLTTVTEGIDTVSRGFSELDGALKEVLRNAEGTARANERIVKAMEEESAAADSISEAISRLTSITKAVKNADDQQASSAQEIGQAVDRLVGQSALIGSLTDEQAARAAQVRLQIDRLSAVVEAHGRIIRELDEAVAAF